MLLSKIKIVLVEPTHPGNIGSVARAMKTMGLSSLVLVNPIKFPHYEASKLAAGAESVLEQAQIYGDLNEAISEATLVVGTSVREREISWPTKNPKDIAETAIEHLTSNLHGSVAILFGRESSGLTNDEMDLCQMQIKIDANPEYSSLNLASAVQILAYELRMCWLKTRSDQMPSPDSKLGTSYHIRQQAATRKQLDGHLEHLQSTIESLNFVKSRPPTQLMRKLTRLYAKAELTVEEIQILRGILSAIDQELSIDN